MNLSEMIITDVLAYNRINVSKGTTIKRNNRPQWAIAIKTSGKTIYYKDHCEYLSDSSHVCILSENSTYSFECFEPGECLMIEFSCSLSSKEFFSIEIDSIDALVEQFNKAEKCSNSKQSGWKMQAFASLYTILSYLLCEKEHFKNREEQLIYPAVKYILEHFNEAGITNEYLASICNISTVYFRKVFLRCYGISPIAYVNELRIEKAKQLLVSDFDSIEQISELVGYNNLYHFSKMFKKKVGIAPSKYKESTRS